MKIKNIREYRTFYKNEIRDLPNRDEHFMGTFYQNGKLQKTYGWFEIYHGDKEGYGKAEEGIGNFLSSFLDMAKDGQAVYEFLQNAVDAGASHFTMAWGKDEIDGNNYVLIANNGEMFNFDSIRSILNVGSSTKTANSQNIGKFGIGFKLAHRLVGKENGLEELLSENPSGPILFSWQNGELKQLAEGAHPEPYPVNFIQSGKGTYQISDVNPWLFKILITCFPALPENRKQTEPVRLSDGKMATTPVFKKTEYEALSRWVKKYRDYLNDEQYKRGALFFIKLGAGKENDLADHNLAEGVRFSLAILQETAEKQSQKTHTLQTVQLNREAPIQKPLLNYQFFHITKEDNLSDYIYVRFGTKDKAHLTSEQKAKLERESDIEVLLGFRDYDKMEDYFKGAPNFYLYFPLSEEVHNFNFVIHSNAFYKASSRTFLHKGTVGEDGINERLLRTIAKRIETELMALFASDKPSDKLKFLHLYAALLTSKESQNAERQWVKEPFINEITKVLKKMVPERSSFESDEFQLSHLHPFIKTTAINLPPHAIKAQNIQWFYWGPDSPNIIRHSAVEKLGLKVFDIFQLLMGRDIYAHVNDWIKEDSSRIKTIFKELNFFDPQKARSENFKANLKNLKLFEFSDGVLLSDNELIEKQDEGYIILHNKLKEIEPELKKAGLKTSLLNLDDFEFYRHYAPYLSPESQLRSQAKLIELISNAKPEKLTSGEKLKLFRVFRDMIEEGRRGERLNELRLFKNQSGKCVKLKNILQKTEISWLKPYIIHTEEKSVDVDRYLLREEENYYERIIYNFWEEIAERIITKDNKSREQIFNQIKQFYEKSEYAADEEKQLTGKGGLFFNGNYQDVEYPVYHEGLAKINYQEYKNVQDLVNKKLGLQIPDYDFLSIYGDSPFSIQVIDEALPESHYSFNENEVTNFLDFCNVCNIKAFEDFTCCQKNTDTYDFNSNSLKNYFTNNYKITAYIDKYLNESLLALPDSLLTFSSLIPLKGNNLNQRLIKTEFSTETQQMTDLLEALLQEDEMTLGNLFSEIQILELDMSWEDERRNSIVLKFIKRLLSGEEVDNKDLQNKIVFEENGNSVALSSIDSANDDVIVSYKADKIKLSRSLILGLNDDGAIRKILDFASNAVERQLLTEKEATQIFKIESTAVTKELIDHFVNNLNNGQLKNTHQLAFVLLEDQFRKKDLSGFKVLDADETWRPLHGNWILSDANSIEYYDKSYVLGKAYNDIMSLIRLLNSNLFYYGNNVSEANEKSKDYILPSFMFRRECTPKVLNSEMDNPIILKYLLERWHITPNEVRIEVFSDEWKDVLGFSPNVKIYSDYILPEEKLEESIIDWINEAENDRIMPLKAIGVQTEDNSIIKLRLWLLDKEDNTNSPVLISQIPFTFLSNTLIGVAEGFIGQQKNAIVFQKGSKKHKLINEIITKLVEAEDSYKIRVPVWKSGNNLCLGTQKDKKPKYLSDEDYGILMGYDEGSTNEALISSVQVIVPNESYAEYIKESYEQIKIRYQFIEPVDAIEHDEPFYKSWNKKHEIKLFRTALLELEYEAYLADDNDNINLGVVSFGDYYLRNNEGSKNIFYSSEISLEALRSSLDKSGETEIAELLQELILERDKMLAAFYHALTSSGKDEFDDEDTKRLRDSLKEKSIDDARKDIINEIRANSRYSYDWFESYIRYLLSFEESANTTSQKSISFQSIEPYAIAGKVSNKYFMLKGANSVIPMNIEAFKDFYINIVFKGGLKENIIVEGVSKKGQDLLTFIPQGIKEKLKLNLNQAVSVKINFSPVLDLVQRLYQAFINRDVITTWENIKETLQPLHFIYGPPGTGKTTKLCNILEKDYQNDPVFKALVLVPTNKAGDVLAKKLIQNKTDLSVIRIGSATDPELETLDDEVYKVSLDDNTFDNANIIISSIHRFPYYQISKEHGAHFKLFDKKIDWDLVIFDESSMISLPYIVFALLSLKPNNVKTQYLVAGDPKQIPPIVDTSDKNLENLDMEDESIYKMLDIKSFKEDEQNTIKRENDIIENLTTQYRSVEPIGRLFSSFSYHNLLHHGRDLIEYPKKTLPKKFIGDLMKPISLINIPIDIETSVLQPRKLLYSSYHVYAGILTSEIIKHLDICNVDKSEYSVGIISPYKAQAMLMNKLIISSGISDSIRVQCDTVHGFQGDECDIVIFVVNPNNTYYTGHKNSLLSKEYVYNVAMSRARDYLWIINPFNDIGNNPHILNIREILGSHVGVIPSGNIEKVLFKDKNFIVKNSYLTGHDNINVFGQVDMKYFIKAGSSAIDIQLRR